MKNNNPIYSNVKKFLNINIAKPNLNLIDSIDWLNKNSTDYIENINKPILSLATIKYLSQLDDYNVLQFLIGFHALNFQFWTPKLPEGFLPYINNELTGFYSCLESYLALFKHLPASRKNTSITQVDLFNFFGDIPNIKVRFSFLSEVWKSELLDTVYANIKNDSKNNIISIETASKISIILPNSFQDPYLRKTIYLLWDYIQITNKNNNTNIITELPMIADHQTAKIFSMYSLMQYNKNLKNKINRGITIESNSSEELAIRACIIFIAEQICRRKKITTSGLYNLMWHMRATRKEPFFLCENTNY